MILDSNTDFFDTALKKAQSVNVRPKIAEELNRLVRLYKHAGTEANVRGILGHIAKYWDVYNKSGYIFGYDKPSRFSRHILKEFTENTPFIQVQNVDGIEDLTLKQLEKKVISEYNQQKNDGKELVIDAYSRKAMEIITNGESVFISGNAGTGKSFLLNHIIEPMLQLQGRRYMLLAPTGVAAKNINGATIHAQLRLPLSPYIPGILIPNLYALSQEDILIVNQLHVLIIDEISMVRCDVLDAIDDVLRKYRHSAKPFGGVQVVFVGDLYQLMPVAPPEDWEKLKEKYQSVYFFSSQVLKRNPIKMLELKTIHRQKDERFKNILNSIRINAVSDYYLDELNKHVDTHFVPRTNDGYIRLCALNKTAWWYNKEMLDKLGGTGVTYKGVITGWYNKQDYPTDYYLELKIGAEVMFVRNDTEYHQFVNGTRAVVLSLGTHSVIVETLDKERKRIHVSYMKWDCNRYHINKQTKRLEIEVCGTFSQLPLKLAWAITIHKSQGLTFNKVVIDLNRAFTAGQVYVALSRCRSAHALILTSKVTRNKIMIDPTVTNFMKTVARIPVDDSVEKTVQSEMNTKIGGRSSVLSMANDGISVEEMAELLETRVELIYNDLSHLIKEGLVDVRQYITLHKYQAIMSAIDKASTEDIKTIKAGCTDSVKFGEIKMVIASRQVKTATKRIIPQASMKQEDNEILEKSEPSKQLKVKTFDALIEVSRKTYDDIKLGRMKVYKKPILDRETADVFMSNPSVFKTAISPFKCPFIPRKINIVRFECAGLQLDILLRKMSFSSVKSLQGRLVWMVVLEF